MTIADNLKIVFMLRRFSSRAKFAGHKAGLAGTFRSICTKEGGGARNSKMEKRVGAPLALRFLSFC
jgi:hypothetical protein